jgi:hypothetical protein
MNIFQLSISTIVFASTLLLGTTAVIASRLVITTVASLSKPASVPESLVVPAAAPERVVDLPDLRNEPPPTPEDFDPTGPYSVATENLTVAFADIEFLEIATHEYVEHDGKYISRPIVPSGSLHTKKSFKFNKIAVNNRTISFETVTKDGTSYRFVGDFPLSLQETYCEECEYPPALKGRLKKLKNGKVVSELEAKFYVYDNC